MGVNFKISNEPYDDITQTIFKGFYSRYNYIFVQKYEK